MGETTGIEWCDASWNPTVGCSLKSPGCTHCYAMGEAARQIRCAAGSNRETHYAGTVETVKGRAVWTGKINAAPDHIWEKPLHWKKPRKIFVNSMSDLFHEDIPDAWIDRAFAIMALCPQHTFQVLTKRSARMRTYVSDPATAARVWIEIYRLDTREMRLPRLDGSATLAALRAHGATWGGEQPWPLRNVWLGVSTERQQEANDRIPDLLMTPAAVRFISAEPLLGPIDLRQSHMTREKLPNWPAATRIDWVIVGGESGTSARPLHPGAARSLRDQCAAADVAFFFKQWGEWRPAPEIINAGGSSFHQFPGGVWVQRVGDKKAGRLLDGREHSEFPAVSA